MNDYSEFGKQELINWIEKCHDLLNESEVPTKEGSGTLSVYGRLCSYKKEVDEQVATLRAERDKAVRLLRMASNLNEEEARERVGAWSISSDFQQQIAEFLAKVKP